MRKVFGAILANILMINGDSCDYIDGQLVRLRDGTLGTINNNNYYDGMCGVSTDDIDHVFPIKMDEIIKVPTIFIEGVNDELVNHEVLHQFIIDHANDKIGLESSYETINGFIELDALPSNAFGYENADALTTDISMSDATIMEKNVHELFMCSSKIVESVFEVDTTVYDYRKSWFDYVYAFSEANRKGSMDKFLLREDNRRNAQIIGRLVNNWDQLQVNNMVVQLTKIYMTEAECKQYADKILMEIKKELMTLLKEDILNADGKFDFIIHETLNDDFIENIRNYEKDGDKHEKNMITLRDLLSSKNIVDKFADELKEGNDAPNIYIIIGEEHVDTLKYFIQQRLVIQKVDTASKRVVLSSIFSWTDVVSQTERQVTNTYFNTTIHGKWIICLFLVFYFVISRFIRG